MGSAGSRRLERRELVPEESRSLATVIDVSKFEQILAKTLEGKDLSQMQPTKPRAERPLKGGES